MPFYYSKDYLTARERMRLGVEITGVDIDWYAEQWRKSGSNIDLSDFISDDIEVNK